MARFPHLETGSDFPNVGNIDVYKYDNDFDYTRYDAVQMDLTVCKVPWDMGEAHIGNRTISGIGNVVYFDSKAERDEWFAAIPDDECYRWSTKSRELHRDNMIVIPVPFNVASLYNYVYVHHHEMASDGSPVEYETDGGLRDWFYFIREVEFLAPNSTRLHLMPDAWQTFIYDINIPYMVLERGHAPLFEVLADEYLQNPKAHCAGLLAEDSYYGDTDIAQMQYRNIYNIGTMLAVMFTTSDLLGDWGTLNDPDDWQVPVSHSLNTGAGSVKAYGIAASSLSAFLDTMDLAVPQFLQTVQGVAFISENLVTKAATQTVQGFTVHRLASEYRTDTLFHLRKSDFGYPARYANLAKLYTYPYSFLRMSDTNGNEIDIHIENTDGGIDLHSKLSLLFPYVNITAYINNIGNAAQRTVYYRTAETMAMVVAGNWLDTLMRFDVPCFGALQSAFVSNYYSEHWNYDQQAVAYTNAYDSEYANADTAISNTALQTTANTSITTRSNTSAADDGSYTDFYNTNVAVATNYWTLQNANSTIQANEMQSAVSAIGSVASAAASLNPVGMISGIVGAVTTQISTGIANGLTATQASNAVSANNDMTNWANWRTGSQVTNQTSTASDITGYQNTALTGQTANSAATQKANATRTKNTAISAVTNSVRASRLGNPVSNGNDANGTDAATRPLGLFFTVMRQNDHQVQRTGDEFLRYGYAYDKQWAFNGNWNIGKHFTYWKLSDLWVKDLKVPDMYVDRIRFFLYGGVTVWRKPEEIGNVSIYENYPEGA